MKKLMENLNETIWENVKKIDKENFDKIENELKINSLFKFVILVLCAASSKFG